MAIRVVRPGQGSLWDLGSRITCKVTSDSTNDEYTVLEVVLATGQGSPLHVHRRESEAIYFAEGECVVGSGGRDQVISPGSVVVFEKGTPHFFRNDAIADAKLIITAVPGGLDRYFDEIDAALQAGKVKEIENINRKYEIEFID